MSDFSQLIEELQTQLEIFDYIQEENAVNQDVTYITYIKKPPLLKVRNLCAMIEVPGMIEENSLAKIYFHNIRDKLLSIYGNALLWKELEICFVVLCDHDLYEILKNDGGKAVAQAGFSLNSMMGTCFIDKSTFDTFTHSTWGIYFSGDHFKAIRETVANWCQEQIKNI